MELRFHSEADKNELDEIGRLIRHDNRLIDELVGFDADDEGLIFCHKKVYSVRVARDYDFTDRYARVALLRIKLRATEFATSWGGSPIFVPFIEFSNSQKDAKDEFTLRIVRHRTPLTIEVFLRSSY